MNNSSPADLTYDGTASAQITGHLRVVEPPLSVAAGACTRLSAAVVCRTPAAASRTTDSGCDVTSTEAERLSSLQAHSIMDTAADPYLDRLARITACKLHVPIVLVNFLDSDRQWAKAAFGLPRGYELPRELAFCSHTLLAPDQVTIIADTTLDARFVDNPIVIGKPHVRFYAGVPILDIEGRALGALCALDTSPRDFTGADSVLLLEIAESVSARLELYHSNAALRESKEHYRNAVASNPIIGWTMSAEGDAEEGEEQFLDLIGASYAQSSHRDWVRAVHPDDLSSALTDWSASLRKWSTARRRASSPTC